MGNTPSAPEPNPSLDEDPPFPPAPNRRASEAGRCYCTECHHADCEMLTCWTDLPGSSPPLHQGYREASTLSMYPGSDDECGGAKEVNACSQNIHPLGVSSKDLVEGTVCPGLSRPSLNAGAYALGVAPNSPDPRANRRVMSPHSNGPGSPPWQGPPSTPGSQRRQSSLPRVPGGDDGSPAATAFDWNQRGRTSSSDSYRGSQQQPRSREPSVGRGQPPAWIGQLPPSQNMGGRYAGELGAACRGRSPSLNSPSYQERQLRQPAGPMPYHNLVKDMAIQASVPQDHYRAHSIEPQRPPSVSSAGGASREPTVDRMRQPSSDRGLRQYSPDMRMPPRPTRPLPAGRILGNGNPSSNSAPSSCRFPQGPSQNGLLGRCLQPSVDPTSVHMMPTMELPMHGMDRHRRSFADMSIVEPVQPIPSPDQQRRSLGALYLDADPRSCSPLPSTPQQGRRGMSPNPRVMSPNSGGRSLSSACPAKNITLPMVMLDD